MKKFISLFLTIIGLSANAATYHFDTFMPPIAAGMIVPVTSYGTTNLYGQSNILWYFNAISYPNYIGPSDFLITDTTNSITNTYLPGPIGGSGYTNFFQYGAAIPFFNNQLWLRFGTNALYIAKWSLTATNTTGGNFTQPVLYDVDNFADYMGNVGSNNTVTVGVQGDVATSSNYLNLVLAASVDGSNYPTSGSWYQSYNILVPGTNFTMTNIVLPNYWNAGTKRTRVISIGATTNNMGASAVFNGTNDYIQVLSRGSYQP